MPRIECRPEVVYPEVLEARLLIPGGGPSGAWRDIAVVPLMWDWLGWGRYAFPVPSGNCHVHLNLMCMGTDPGGFGLNCTFYGQQMVSDFLRPVSEVVESQQLQSLEFVIEVPGQLVASPDPVVPVRIEITPAANQAVNLDEPYYWDLVMGQGACASDDPCRIDAITPDEVLIPVGTWQTFSAQGCNTGSALWQSHESVPANGIGYSFTTRWHLPGVHQVSAACQVTRHF